MGTLYQTTVIIKRLRKYFEPYISLLTKPSGQKMLMLLLAILAMQFVTSVNYLHKWFLSGVGNVSLNAYYYLLTYTHVPIDMFYKATIRLAISVIPEALKGLPIFIIIDDTLQPKFGTKFACCQTMYDHAKHNGTNYLKGHCFVALSIRVPVLVGKELRHLHVPIGYRLRGENENKLGIAAEMIDLAMEVLADCPMVILLCDSWYPKGMVIKTVKKYANLELVANTRADTSLFDLPPDPSGKRGRPPVKGRKLDIHTDFNFIRVGDYFIAVKVVLTNLFEKLPVYVTVTTPDLLNHNAYRVFISTVQPEQLRQCFGGYEKTLSTSINSLALWLLPVYLYSFRWAIEVMFYEHKTFWSFGLYRLRSKEGITNFVNFSSITYACMKLLPFVDERFSALAHESPQTCKYVIGDAIRCELFLSRFGLNPETTVYSHDPLGLFGILKDDAA